jgi:hypothetical protein
MGTLIVAEPPVTSGISVERSIGVVTTQSRLQIAVKETDKATLPFNSPVMKAEVAPPGAAARMRRPIAIAAGGHNDRTGDQGEHQYLACGPDQKGFFVFKHVSEIAKRQ